MICGALAASLVLCGSGVAFAKVANMSIPVSYNNIKVIVDGKELQTSKEPFTYEGTTYLPIRAVAEAVGKDVTWDGNTKTVYLGEKPVTQTPNLQQTDYVKQLSVEECAIEKYGNCYYYLVVTNNSSETLSINSNVVTKDSSGKLSGAEKSGCSAVGSGETAVLEHIFDEEPYSADYSLTAEKETSLKSMTKYISYDVTKSGDKLIVSCTNNSDKDCDSTKAEVFFFKNGKVVDYDYTYFGDTGFGVNAGSTVVEEIRPSYGVSFDKYVIYVSANRW